MEPLRIGITCYPTFGGSGIIATEVGVSMALRGHRVHFISSDVPSRLDRMPPNVFFHAVESCDYPLFEHSPYALALASKMVEVATWEPLDLLHVHYAIPHAASAYLARQILGPRAPRILTTLHGTDITLVGSDPAFLPITRFSIVESDAVTAPSEALREATYENLAVPRDVAIEVIPNFVDETWFRPAPREPSVLERIFDRAGLDWKNPAARPRLLVHNSNFRAVKRVPDVIRIFAEVRRTIPTALLALIGDGPERSRVEALVRELELGPYVAFLGKQLHFVEVLQQGDLFLLPSETESFGLAALEALACGVPVVASNVGGLPEVVVEGESGYLREPADVKSMAEAALHLLEDDAAWAAFSQAARRQVEARWRREPMVSRYEECYRRLLDR